ncbi:von Willebrand factor type A domain-containing protein [Flavobacterium sp.]|uniref:vWA domain-containing protein n=1 Tax=Flavobacterium sp. TaxID=239 RepID=UPI002623995C|nr:von Willebrand factor type A domain-containing protein [Flavobacterium sp.]
MENQDKIYEQFKEAAGKAEQKGFDRMEAVWSRVEEKLDEKKKRRGIAWWKYTGAAAMLLLFISIGNLIMRNDADPVVNPNVAPERNVTTVIDTQKVNETFTTERQVEHIIADIDTTPKNKFEKSNPIDNSYSSKEYIINGRHVVEEVKYKPLEAQKKVNTPVVESETMVLRSPRYFNDVIAKPTAIQGYVNQSLSNSATISQNPDNQYSAVTSNRYPIKREDEKYNERKAAAITTLSAEEVEDRANASVLRSLQGQVAGLNIATGKGQPGADTTIVLRGIGSINGDTEPLFIVDGVPVDEDGFRSINQNDIDSYEILSDASATSIYGNRGANGVILISTKSGAFQEAHYERPEEIKAKLDNISRLPGENTVYIIDGIVVDEDVIDTLNPNDIATCDIYKNDPNTLLYSNRGNSPTVVFKTKGGLSKKTKRLIERSRKNNSDTPQRLEFQQVKPKAKIQVDQEEYESFEENKFENTATVPLSTFSIDVDNASYTNVRRFLNNGQIVPKDAVRVEEMINFFKYQYPQPTGNDVFSINTEYSDAPWNPKHKLLKIGLKGKDIPTADLPASNFVFLIDVSGSMSDSNKLPLLKQSMKLLVNQMRPQDRIAIVVYAGAAGLVLPSTSGGEKSTIINALNKLEAGGSTAGGAGIELAYKTALENFIKGGNNRVILATDGDFNVGASSNTDMQTLIEEKRKSGVFLTCLGYGMGNYKDSKMEILADKGNGNYAYIDNMQEADRFLQKEFKGSMFAIAKDVKIQIELNPKHVQSYRLIGYENRKLRNEDFANDAIDAGELGSGHTVTALYEIIPVGVESDYFTPAPELKYSEPVKTSGNYSDELATIKFRHKKPDEDVSKETVKVIPNVVTPLSNTSGDFKFAAAVAWFGLKLRDSKLVPNKETKAIIELAKQGQQPDPEGYRAEFIRLVEMVE